MTAATTPDEREGLGYRPALDGVRAVAILAVVIAHTVGTVGGLGQVGVTVFFVLSGYLITRLLLIERDRDGSISLRAFYLRRAARLFPALVVMVIAITALRWGQDRAISDAGWALSYAGNWWSVYGDGMGPLDHTWTLAVEEQFYLLWPPLLVVASRRALPIAVGLLLMTVAANALTPWGDWNVWARSSAFQAPAILLGLILAYLPRPSIGRLGPLITFVALGVLLWIGSRELDETWHRYADLLTALAAAPMILVALQGGVLGWGPLPYLGRISYSLYLWHVPIALMTDWPVWLMIGVSMLAAVASYHLVEQPVLRLIRLRFFPRVDRERGVPSHSASAWPLPPNGSVGESRPPAG